MDPWQEFCLQDNLSTFLKVPTPHLTPDHSPALHVGSDLDMSSPVATVDPSQINDAQLFNLFQDVVWHDDIASDLNGLAKNNVIKNTSNLAVSRVDNQLSLFDFQPSMIEGLNASSYNENDAISAQNLIESIDRALLQMPTHRNSAATTQPPNFTSALASIQLHPDMINAFINDPSIDLWNIPADSTTTNTPSDRLHETTTIKRKRAKSQSRHMKRSRFSSDMYTGMNPPATPSTCFRNSPTYSPSTMHPNLYHNNSQTQRSRDSRFQLVDLQTIAHAQEEYIQRKELLEARQQKYEQHTGWF